MHIPDGYLSPSTCAVMYGAVSPFWVVAARKVRQGSDDAGTPSIALLSSFSFVLMMFNLPLPGGTTGHATGAALAGIVLGPWTALLALSCTLGIQAAFFGDGGVLTLGANCFNIALVTPCVGAFLYRLFSGRSQRSRVIASAIGAYVATNCAGLCAAIELGVQPLLFSDASGKPLYCPFPIGISVPGIMIGHLSIIGLLEAALTAGICSYLWKHEPAVMRSGAAGRTVKLLPWLVLGVLAAAAPLGLIASGEGWGEWEAYTTRTIVPFFGEYGATSLRYALSALAGMALCAGMLIVLVRWVARDNRSLARQGPLERAGRWLTEMSDTPPSRPDIDARLVLAAAAVGILIVNLVHSFSALLAAALIPACCCLIPAFDRTAFARRVAASVSIAALLFVLPAAVMLSGARAGPPAGSLAALLTREGLDIASRLLLRSVGSVSFAAAGLIIAGTARALAALHPLSPRLPLTLGLSFRYAALLGRSMGEVEAAYASRSTSKAGIGETTRHLGAALRKTLERSKEVHLAMVSRGHGGPMRPATGRALGAGDIRFAIVSAVALLIPVAIDML